MSQVWDSLVILLPSFRLGSVRPPCQLQLGRLLPTPAPLSVGPVSPSDAFAPFCARLLTRESEEQMADLAGNAMTSTIVGTCILAALVLGQAISRSSLHAPSAARALHTPRVVVDDNTQARANTDASMHAHESEKFFTNEARSKGAKLGEEWVQPSRSREHMLLDSCTRPVRFSRVHASGSLLAHAAMTLQTASLGRAMLGKRCALLPATINEKRTP
eukprot:6206138-Pleurochrysis_carterae.AAC.3